VVAVAGGIVAIWGAIRIITKFHRWLRSWKLLKRKEFERLIAVEAEYKTHKPQIERHEKWAEEAARDIEDQVKRMSGQIKIDEDWDPHLPLRNK
jgi:hypothetical protein